LRGKANIKKAPAVNGEGQTRDPGDGDFPLGEERMRGS